MTNPLSYYQSRTNELVQQLVIHAKRKSWLGWTRFLVFLTAIAAAWLSWNSGFVVVITIMAVMAGLFLFILAKDLDNNSTIENIQRLKKINATEQDILAHHFVHLAAGEEYKPETHEYANDLDLFGRASVFQYINRAATEQGRRLFANWLLLPSAKDTIPERQKAIKELATDTPWRQQLQAHSTVTSVSIATQKRIAA